VCGSEIPQQFDSQGRDVQINYQYSGLSTSGYKGFKLTAEIASKLTSL